MTRISSYIFACGIAAFSTAALAQELPVGTQLPNGGGVITGYGVGPKGNPVYVTTKGEQLQSVVNQAVTAGKVTPGSGKLSSGTPSGTWSVVKNAPTAPAAPAPVAVKAH